MIKKIYHGNIKITKTRKVNNNILNFHDLKYFILSWLNKNKKTFVFSNISCLRGNKIRAKSVLIRELKNESGFTLIELLISVAIIALVFISLLGVYQFNYNTLQKIKDLKIAASIAENLKEEILSKSLTKTSEKSENNIRVNFESVYDYNNYKSDPVQDMFGIELEQYKNFGIAIKLRTIEPDKYNNIISVNKSDYIEVNVSVLKQEEGLLKLPFIITK